MPYVRPLPDGADNVLEAVTACAWIGAAVGLVALGVAWWAMGEIVGETRTSLEVAGDMIRLADFDAKITGDNPVVSGVLTLIGLALALHVGFGLVLEKIAPPPP